MSSTYTPVPVELGDITLIDDGDPKSASGINTPIEAIANGIAFLVQDAMYLETASYTATGTLTVPAGATHCFYEMCGGGGQGGGAYIAAGSGRSDSPGGGGGGAVLCCGWIEVIAGETLNYNIGAGGSAAGVGGSSASNGSNGSDTTLVRATGSVTLATARGAGGGARGTSDNASADTGTVLATDEDGSASPVYRVSAGGQPAKGAAAAFWRTFDKPLSIGGLQQSQPHSQAGGNGMSRTMGGAQGGSSPQGFAGGLGGDTGTTSSTYFGGSGGGGGGAGPFGAGGVGGHGGNGNGSGSGATGVTSGTAAAANTGAGGGGGGAAGGSNTTTGNGGAGGAGGSGKVKLTFVRTTA